MKNLFYLTIFSVLFSCNSTNQNKIKNIQIKLANLDESFSNLNSDKVGIAFRGYKENIELVSLAHFRGRTFDHSICIVDEFQNLTKQQLQMVVSRLGKHSTMILCGDRYQIDLKFSNDSAIHEVPKIKESKYVNEIILTDNHRHESLEEILNLLNEKY